MEMHVVLRLVENAEEVVAVYGLRDLTVVRGTLAMILNVNWLQRQTYK